MSALQCMKFLRSLLCLGALLTLLPVVSAQQATPEVPLLSSDALMASGSAKLQNGDFDGALADFLVAIERDPTSFPAYYGLGDAHFALEDCAQAIIAYERALELEPAEIQATDFAAPLAHVKMGKCHADAEDFERALAEFNSALELAPDMTQVYLERAFVFVQLEDPDSAADDLSRVLETGDPDWYQQVYEAAIDFWRRHEQAAALIYLNPLIDKAPAAHFLYLLRGAVYAELSDVENAARDYLQRIDLAAPDLIELQPDSLEGPITLDMSEGTQYRIAFDADTGDMVSISAVPVEATVDPLIVLLDPSGAPLIGSDDTGDESRSSIEDFALPAAGTYVLAVSYAGGGSEGELEVVMTVTAALAPTATATRSDLTPDHTLTPSPDAHDLAKQAAAAYERGEYDLAVRLITQVIVAYPDDLSWVNTRVIYNYARGDTKAALADLNRVIESPPNGQPLAPLYGLRGDLHDILGDYELALADYAEALEHNPEFAGAYYNRGYAEYVHGDLVAAAADWHQAQMLDPFFEQLIEPHLESTIERVIELEATEEYEEIVRLLTLILDTRLDPYSDLTVLRVRMVDYYYLGMYAEAIADATQLIEVDPAVTTAFVFRGLANSKLGNAQAALGDLRNYVQLAGDSTSPAIYGLIADLVLLLDGPDAAPQTGIFQSTADQIVFQSSRDGYERLYVMAADGTNQRPIFSSLVVPLQMHFLPRVSSDGTRIQYTSRNEIDGTVEVFVFDIPPMDGGSVANDRVETADMIAAQLTDNSALDIGVAWSPDGERLLFVSDRNGGSDLFVMAADGSDARQLTRDQNVGDRAAWSPDGSQIAYQVRESDGIAEIYISNADGTGAQRITDTNAFNNPTTWMPDGRSLLICSNRDGDYDIYEIGLDGEVLRQLTNWNGNECFPRLSPDGSMIVFYRETFSGNRIVVMAADGSSWRELTNGRSEDLFPDWVPASALMSEEEPKQLTTCSLSAERNTILRRGPGTNFDTAGTLTMGAEVTAVGLSLPTGELRWWRLDSNAWVREDLVTAADECLRLPVSGVDN